MREFFRDKRIRASANTILTAVVLVAGVIMDVPDAIVRLAENGPAILTSPNTWWVIIVSAVGSAIMYAIWRRPDEGTRTLQSRYDMYSVALKTATLREFRLIEWLYDIESLEAVIREVDNQVKVQYVFHVLEVVYQSKIVELLEGDFQQTYLDALNYSKQRSGNVAIVTQTVLPKLENAILKAIEEEQNKPRSANRPQPIAD